MAFSAPSLICSSFSTRSWNRSFAERLRSGSPSGTQYRPYSPQNIPPENSAEKSGSDAGSVRSHCGRTSGRHKPAHISVPALPHPRKNLYCLYMLRPAAPVFSRIFNSFQQFFPYHRFQQIIRCSVIQCCFRVLEFLKSTDKMMCVLHCKP